MLSFQATPNRVREATKLAYRYGVPVTDSVATYWQNMPLTTQIPNFNFKLKPYQAEGVRHLEKWDGNVLLADEPGLGKTAQVMAYAFKNHLFPMCVILPKTLLLNWRREIGLMTGQQLKIQIVGFVPSKRRQAELLKHEPHVHYFKTPQPGYDVTLINYDIVHQNVATLEALAYEYVVCDESHKIKNIKAQRSLAVIRLVSGRVPVKHTRNQWEVLHGGCKRATFCTGTPIVNRPLELWTTVSTIAPWHPDFATFWGFASKYCDARKTKWGWNFSGHSQLPELHKTLTDTIMIRRRKQDVLKELPPKTFITVPLEFDRAEYDVVARAFEGRGDWKQGMETLVQYGGNPAKSDEAIVAINKCREIAAYAKLTSVIEWIEDFVEEGAKLVVFAHHQKMVDDIHDTLKVRGHGVRKIRGGIGLEERAQAAEDFQNDPDVKVIVLNIASAGFGITLTAASACAFVQLPWTPGDLIQAADRVHRIGQADNVTVYNLVAEHTVEEQIGDLIITKAEVMNLAVDGGANQELSTMKLSK